MPSDRIFHYKPNGLPYFHLEQLKHVTEWQLTGTFEQKTQWGKKIKKSLRLLSTFNFFLSGSS